MSKRIQIAPFASKEEKLDALEDAYETLNDMME